MKVSIESTEIDGVKIVRPEVFEDQRGFFQEVFRADEYAKAGMPTSFVQFNHSGSVKNTVRGLHFQWEPPMGKLMRVSRGTAFLVAVDLRKDSPTLGKWIGVELSEKDRRLVWAPASFARGFAVLSDFAEIEYLTTGTYNAAGESGVLWNDPAIGVAWPVKEPILSAKDVSAQTLATWLAKPESNKFRL
ncbi:MAG TPA: dTDP-4-dehydrorhamnose 3,5-epimerase [Methylocystis sp.]|nr:dTDP-4-dehydrorhamnose 3,5-epimerase [Methylocystis sp.]